MNPAQGRPESISPAVLLLPVFLLFYGLGSFGLLNNVEGMYAEISREMLVSADWRHWVIPHLNSLPYIEKPPLLYWTQALSMALLGETDVAVRLVPTLASLASMASLWWYGRRLHGERFGRMAAFLLGTSLGFSFLCKIAMTDPLLSACFGGALFSSHLAWVERRKYLLRWAMLWLALAVLTKGFVALALYLGVWGTYWIFCMRGQRWQMLRFFAGIDAWAVFFGVAAPWHLAAALSLEGFSWFYFINEHVLRFLGLREPKDYYSGTPFYYVPRLILMSLPWAFLLAAGPILRKRHGLEDDPGIISARGFLWAAALFPLFFFSVSAAKANYYVLVCLPALALLAATELCFARRGWLDWLNSHFGAVALSLGLVLVPAMVFGVSQAGAGEEQFSARHLAREILRRDDALPVYLYQDYEDYSALPFYLRRSDLRVVDIKSQDLAFALKQYRDVRAYPSLPEFLASPQRAWLVVLDARVRNGLPEELSAVLQPITRVGNATLYLRGP